MSVLDVNDLLTHLGADNSPPEQGQVVLDAAEAAIANRIGPLASTAFTVTVEAACTTLVLPHARIVAVTDPASGATVDQATGIVTYPTGFTAGQVVTYTAGFSTLPGDLRLAVLELARHMWSKAYRATGGPRTNDAAPVLGGYLLPAAVESLLEPYTGMGFA